MTEHGPYIKPLDGLRAVAVLAVLLFHLDIVVFEGGFIGVDVFFVISGFLITKNIVGDINSGSFSFSQFYIKRVARLFPALFMTIALTLIAAFWVLGPNDLARLGHVSVLTVLSSANILFWLESGYFDAAAATKPLLHTWSLAVEEQFYLLWPITIWLAFTKGGLRFAIIMIAILATISLATAVAVHGKHPGAVFFLAPFRVHQFAIGAILALVGIGARSNLASVTFILSLVTLAFLCAVIDGDESNYFLLTVAPALAAGGAIWSIQSRLSELILGSSVARWVGRCSYSIYLTHWPIIVLWKMSTDFSLSSGEKVLGFAFSIAAGAALHYGVEKRFRFRRGQNQKFRGAVLASVTAFAVCVMAAGAHYWGLQGLPWRIPAELQAYGRPLGEEWASRQSQLRTNTCNFPINQIDADRFDPKVCASPQPGKQSILVVGDSFGSDTYLVMTKAFPDIYVGQVTLPGCQLRHPKRFEDETPCKELYHRALMELAPQFDAVVLASNWLAGKHFRIDDLLLHFEAIGVPTILVGQHIRFADRLPNIISSSISLGDAVSRSQRAILDVQFDINKTIDERFASRTLFIDFMKMQCPTSCTIFDEKMKMLYLDDSHISMAGAAVLATRMRSIYGDRIQELVESKSQ